MNFEWIDSSLLLDFQAEGTDAHRICTCQDGWIERFGRDVLISFKSVLARESMERAEHYVHQLHNYSLHATMERDA